MKAVVKTLNKELEFIQNAFQVLENYQIGDCFTVNDIPERKRLMHYTKISFCGAEYQDTVHFTGATAKALLARGILEVANTKDSFIRIKNGVTIKCPINIYRLTKTYDDYKKELYQQIERAF